MMRRGVRFVYRDTLMCMRGPQAYAEGGKGRFGSEVRQRQNKQATTPTPLTYTPLDSSSDTPSLILFLWYFFSDTSPLQLAELDFQLESHISYDFKFGEAIFN